MLHSIPMGACVIAASLAVAPSPAQPPEERRPYPVPVTERTRADPRALAALEAPGTIIFSDTFDAADALDAALEVGGRKDGRAVIDFTPGHAHAGKGALRLTAKSNDGKSSGAGPVYWFGDPLSGSAVAGATPSPSPPSPPATREGGYERVYLRYYIKWADGYDQGNLNHTGGGLSGVAGSNKWGGMGTAGIRPKGDEYFSTGFESWRDWGRVAAPGYMFCYTYWMDMRIDKDGHYWGNMLGPEPADRFVPERGRWYCMEVMVKANTITPPTPTPGESTEGGKNGSPGGRGAGVANADGELAAWIDGRLYTHFTGIRWRGSDAVRIKRASLGVYIHESRRDNTVWYDDLVISTGYVGPAAPRPEAGAPAAGDGDLLAK